MFGQVIILGVSRSKRESWNIQIREVVKDLAREHDFKNKKFIIKIRNNQKIERKNCIGLVFLFMKKKKNIQSM